jgi:DNA-binding helix-hairpin-helix protein with protein kinase domain
MLPNGFKINTESGAEWLVEEKLGGGGQGEVYRVSNGSAQRALKWYYPHAAFVRQLDNLRYIINSGAPSDRFVWPEDLVRAADGSTFGYLMPLREPRFKSLNDLMRNNIETTFRAICTACFELAHHYRLLHSKGLAYYDISLGNIFFDPQTGEIRIVDNDNVSVNQSSQPAVCGTPRFMAPEIVRGEAQPSTETDLFSLAVLMFHLLFVSHPFDGEQEYRIHCFDLPAMQRLYGNPIFIFDPNNHSNRPVPDWHNNAILYWEIYPQFIRDLFTRAFTDGLRPERRVRESEWQRAMAQLRDLIIYSPDGSENFYDPELLRQGKPHICWHSKKAITLPPRMKIEDRLIAITHTAVLTEYHFTGNYDDFYTVRARVVPHPTQRGIFGLQNESNQTWSFTDANGNLQTVSPGQRITIRDGLRLNFGRCVGEIRA